jgi:hypothetical protein
VRGREVLPGLYKQLHYLNGEVSLLRVRLRIHIYLLVFSLVIHVLLFCLLLIGALRHRKDMLGGIDI